MKTYTYIGKRLILFIFGITSLRYATYYTLPRNIREDGFGFVAELDRFFTLCFIFSLFFLIYILSEIRKFNSVRSLKLRNMAIYFSLFLLLYHKFL